MKIQNLSTKIQDPSDLAPSPKAGLASISLNPHMSAIVLQTKKAVLRLRGDVAPPTLTSAATTYFMLFVRFIYRMASKCE